MPRGDRTGPCEMGPMTGRAAGFCAGYPMPGYANPAFRRGMGMGRGGGGRGWRHMYYATGLPGWARVGYPPAWGMPPVSPYQALPQEQEVDMLKQHAQALGEQLSAINERIAELEKQE
jgi:hypothetical protein